MAQAAKSRAEIEWHGDLRGGSGELRSASEAFGPLTMKFAAREQPGSGNTNPEELIAAALATCFAMAFSNVLAQNGTPAETLRVTAEASLERTDAGLKITRMDLTAGGTIPGLDSAKFAELAKTAEQRCPVSNALRGNVDIALSASL